MERRVLALCFFFMAILVGAHGETTPTYKNPSKTINDRINDLMSRMTLAEKIGQMTQIERSVASQDVMRDYFIGSVLSGGGSVPAPNATAEQWMAMVSDFQKGSLSSRLGIPMIYGIDAVHGHGNVYKATIFPHNVGLGATRDPDLAMRIGAAVALEVRATGIPYIFAPCIAVCRDPRWGRCYESFSENPELVRNMTKIISGFQGEVPRKDIGRPFVAGQKNVAACAKHYAGDGGTVKGINENNTIATEHDFFRLFISPYNKAVYDGVSTIMISYSSWNGVKMHTNKTLITGYLKDQLKFRGFVISDWQGLDRIFSPPGSNYRKAVELGISAGIDMIMVPMNYSDFIGNLTSLVDDKTIDMSRIDDAVRRILRVKFMMGLFENPYPDYSLVGELGKQEHRDLAREAVRKSLVLLKNGKSGEPPLLPLKKSGKILVAGSHAYNLGYQCGGWTITWQGQGGNNITSGTTILEGINSTVTGSGKVVYSEEPSYDDVKYGGFEYAIVVVGEPSYAEGQGDNLNNLTILEPGPSVIDNVCSNVKCVVVLISGRPIVIEPYINKIDALVAAWLPGTEGQGVADVLFGAYGFSGKLPRTWFKSVDQLPMNVNDKHYDPLFAYDYGLTTMPSNM